MIQQLNMCQKSLKAKHRNWKAETILYHHQELNLSKKEQASFFSTTLLID